MRKVNIPVKRQAVGNTVKKIFIKKAKKVIIFYLSHRNQAVFRRNKEFRANFVEKMRLILNFYFY